MERREALATSSELWISGPLTLAAFNAVSPAVTALEAFTVRSYADTLTAPQKSFTRQSHGRSQRQQLIA